MTDFFEDKSEQVIEYRFKDPQRAYDICCEILEHGAETNDWYEISYAHLYMGDTLFSMGRLAESIEHMLIGEKVQKEYGYDDLLMKNYNITAIIYMTQGDDFLALDYFYYAMELAEQYGNYVLQGLIYNNIGVLLHNRGDASSAAWYFEQGIKVSRKKGIEDKDIVFDERQFYINMSGKYIEEKNYLKAKEYMDIATTQYDGKQTSVSEVSIMSAYAVIYSGLGNEPALYDICVKALHLPREAYEEVESFEDYLDIFVALMKIKHIGEAEQLLHILSEVCERNDIRKHKVRLCEAYIELYETTGNYLKLNETYHEYYTWKKKLEQEKKQAVITAIDNRCRLEDEKTRNAKLTADNRELSRESEVDELTGIYNRYGIRRRFRELYKIAEVDDQKLCMAIFDIDFFKEYNDQYGHLQGDACLQKVAQILQKTASNLFFIARYGGDEFLIVGINKTNDEIECFAQNLLNNIREARISFQYSPIVPQITISFGAVNAKVEDNLDILDFVYNADKVLYKVKKKGRNNYMVIDME